MNKINNSNKKNLNSVIKNSRYLKYDNLRDLAMTLVAFGHILGSFILEYDIYMSLFNFIYIYILMGKDISDIEIFNPLLALWFLPVLFIFRLIVTKIANKIINSVTNFVSY